MVWLRVGLSLGGSRTMQAMYKPLNTSKPDEEKKVKKWPDRLGRTPNQSFDSEGRLNFFHRFRVVNAQSSMACGQKWPRSSSI